MNLHDQRSQRSDLSEAAKAASALKQEFRRESVRLVAEGRGQEIQKDARRNLGISENARGRLVGVAGFSFR